MTLDLSPKYKLRSPPQTLLISKSNNFSSPRKLNKTVKNVKDFFTIDQELQQGEKLEVVVMRNQAEKILSIKTK